MAVKRVKIGGVVIKNAFDFFNDFTDFNPFNPI